MKSVKTLCIENIFTRILFAIYNKRYGRWWLIAIYYFESIVQDFTQYQDFNNNFYVYDSHHTMVIPHLYLRPLKTTQLFGESRKVIRLFIRVHCSFLVGDVLIIADHIIIITIMAYAIRIAIRFYKHYEANNILQTSRYY